MRTDYESLGEATDAPGTKMIVLYRVCELEAPKRRRQDRLRFRLQLFEDLREP
jgi:hypothetical protein